MKKEINKNLKLIEKIEEEFDRIDKWIITRLSYSLIYSIIKWKGRRYNSLFE